MKAEKVVSQDCLDSYKQRRSVEHLMPILCLTNDDPVEKWLRTRRSGTVSREEQRSVFSGCSSGKYEQASQPHLCD